MIDIDQRLKDWAKWHRDAGSPFKEMGYKSSSAEQRAMHGGRGYEPDMPEDVRNTDQAVAALDLRLKKIIECEYWEPSGQHQCASNCHQSIDTYRRNLSLAKHAIDGFLKAKGQKSENY